MSTSVNDELMYKGNCNVVTPTRDASGNVTGLSAGGARVGSVCLLHYENDGGFIALPESAEQIVGSVVFVPANTFKPGDKLQVVCFSEDAGTASAAGRTLRLRAHTTDSVMSGVAMTTIRVYTGNNSKMAIDKAIGIVSNTKAKSSSPGQPGSIITTAAFADATIDCTVDQYIGFTIQNENTLVNHLIYYANLTLEPAQ